VVNKMLLINYETSYTRCVNTNTPFFLKTMITNVAGMWEVRLGLDLSTICSSEDDDVNSEGGTSTGAWVAPKQPKMESVRRCGRSHSEVGSSLAPGLQGGVAMSGPRWRRVAWSTRASSGASSHCRPDLGVDAEPRVELRPRWVAEEVRHPLEYGRQLQCRRVPSGEQRGWQLDGGLGGAETAEDGERPEVRQAAQRGRVEPGPGPAGRGGDVGA
jgi:hypothetical protein